MNNLYDLVKRIDALTANSQQVLNALIRSCIASGSSNGYKVTKYGTEIELTRADIYRLYDFYQTWEAAGFPSGESEFSSLLAAADARWRKTAASDTKLATDAVVKHSKILYMNGNNSSSGDDYWLSQVRESASPKATVSSAPIPLNLRTPLYDENLSVKSFSQFETYLFPMGYHRAELLGTRGNGEDYIAGGENWTIDVTDTILIRGNHITMGNVSSPQNRLDNYRGNNTISWGNESYALDSNSLAFGTRSVASADEAIVFGTECIGYGEQSFIGGGLNIRTVGRETFASNQETCAIGARSFAANFKTSSGGQPYKFTIAADVNVEVNTECDVQYIESEKVCVATSSTSDLFGSVYQVLRVDIVGDNDLGFVGDTGKTVGFDIKVDDQVTIFDLVYRDASGKEIAPSDVDGYTRQKFGTVVDLVTEGTDENTGRKYYLITLRNPIPAPNAKYGVYVSGRIAAKERENVDPNLLGVSLGEDSATFGSYIIAHGTSQLGAGSGNIPNADANLIVGTGVWEPEGLHRANGLLVSPEYGFMKLANGRGAVGVSTSRRLSDDDEQYLMHEGAFLKGSSASGSYYTLVNAGYTNAMMSAVDNDTTEDTPLVAHMGVGGNLSEYFPGEYGEYVKGVFRTMQGTAVLASGSYIMSDGTGNLVTTLLEKSNTIRGKDEHGVAIYAEDGIEIRNTENDSGRGINIETCSYLTMRFQGLMLEGDTFGTLAASDKSRSFRLSGGGTKDGTTGKEDDILIGHTAGYSGFFYGDVGTEFQVLAKQDWTGISAHLYNNAVTDDDGTIHVASIAIPSSDVNGTSTVRPSVVAGTIQGVGNSNDPGTVYQHDLAYYDDLTGWATSPVSNFGYFVATGSSTPSSDALMSTGPTGVSGGDIVLPVAQSVDNDSWTVSSTYKAIVKNMGGQYDAMKKYHSSNIVLSSSNDTGNLAVHYSLVGNVLRVYFKLSFENAPSDVNDLTGLRIPVVIGCATTRSGCIPGTSSILSSAWIIPGQGGYVYSSLGGEIVNRSVSDISARRCCGYAISNGIIVVELSHVTNWTALSCGNLHGEVIYTADPACRGGEVNGTWQSAMENAYDGKVVMPYSHLTGFIGGV